MSYTTFLNGYSSYDRVTLQRDTIMNEETKAAYIRRANHFIESKILAEGVNATERNIRLALIANAANYRPASWRGLRIAIAVQQESLGYKKTADSIRSLTNPSTDPILIADGLMTIKQKQKRCKSVKKSEHRQLRDYFESKKDFAAGAAIEIALLLGCRPAEMLGIEMRGIKNGSYRVFITGAKKSEDGQRGLDRELIVTEENYNTISRSKLALHDEAVNNSKNSKPGLAMHRVQRRLENATRKLWPERKHRITLYSYRHLLGSDLKASGLKREEVAAIMGHQSVDSVDLYGDKRTSKRKPDLRATLESIAAVRKTTLKKGDFIANKTTAEAVVRAEKAAKTETVASTSFRI